MSLIACTETKLSSFPKEMYFYWILPPPFGSTFLKVLTTVSLHNKGNDLLPNPNPCWSSCMHLRNILPSAIQNVNSIYFLVMYGCCFVVYKAHSYIISYLGTQALIALEWKYFHNNLSAILWCLSYSYMNQWQVKYAELQLNEKSTLHCFEGHSHSASEAMISGCSSKKHQLCEVALSFRSISLTADSTQCGQCGWKHPCWPSWLHSELNEIEPLEILLAVQSSNRGCPTVSKCPIPYSAKRALDLNLWWDWWSTLLLSLSSPTYNLGVVTGKRTFWKVFQAWITGKSNGFSVCWVLYCHSEQLEKKIHSKPRCLLKGAP